VADEVIGRVRAKFDPARDYVILEGHPDWHLGIIGIVASRVLHEFHRPTIILGGDGSEWRGSGRSVEGFDIAAALRECRELLLRHGGHPMAAGLTVRPENIDTLRDRLNVLARNVLTPEQLTPGLRLDAEVSLRDLTVQNLAEMQRLQPFGQGNPQVHVIVRQVAMRETRQRIGKEGKHLKFRLTDGHDECEVVWWGGADQQAPSAKFDLACVPQLDSFGGQLKPQLKFLDWRPAQPGHVHSG
jgi:single-stranded-DNA-specific exonuclease